MEQKIDSAESNTNPSTSSKVTTQNLEKVVQLSQNEDFMKVYKVFKQEYVILAEYKMVQSENIHGVYVIPSRENPLVWFGVIFVRNGPYEEGVFRFTMFLDDKFPDCSHPRIVFHNPTFHPVIQADTNELDLSKAFPTWNNKENYLWQVLKYIYWIFNNPEASLSHGVNKEACDLLTQNKAEFVNKIKEIVKATHSCLYNDPPTEDKHYITFAPFNSEIHDKKKLSATLKPKEPSKKGYSWVLPRKFRPLERPESSEGSES